MEKAGSEEMRPNENSTRASLWALVVFIPWLIAMGLALNDWYKDVQLEKKALWTSGVITKIEVGNHAQADYEYSVDGVTYSGGEIIAGASLGAGQQVRVSYIKDAPQISRLTHFGEIGTRPAPILFCTFIALVGYVRLRKFLKGPDNRYDE